MGYAIRKYIKGVKNSGTRDMGKEITYPPKKK